MISLIIIILAIISLGFGLKKSNMILSMLSIFIISLTIAFNINIRKFSISFYTECPLEYQFTTATDIKISDDGLIESISLKNGIESDIYNKFNKYLIQQQYHNDEIEVHLYEIKYELENKLLHYLTGIPIYEKGYFFEVGVPAHNL